MKNDVYLKTILTVIASALIILICQNAKILPEAHANNSNFPVGNTLDVRVVEWKVYKELDVNVKKWTYDDEIDVNLDRVGNWYINNGVLKVKVEE